MDLDDRTDALLVIDLQPDFMPGGALAVEEGDRIAAPLGALARRFSTVVATQDFHPRGHVSFASTHGRRPFETVPLYGAEQTLWPDHCLAGAPGAALHPALPDDSVALILRKGTRRDVDSYSAFRENLGPDGARATTGLGAWLKARGIRRVFVAGLARDFCVKHSALDAAAEGFETFVLDDLTRAVDARHRAADDRAFAAAGVELLDSAALIARSARETSEARS
ncbi:MAG TPA: bifunctional nicotinamidase/pyrazinamidase [Polyangia bacterium]|nr:bifunctional nicotinamidase/pyrazinamidase [Polyangia bacterium]